jgi:hypothetical protein
VAVGDIWMIVGLLTYVSGERGGGQDKGDFREEVRGVRFPNTQFIRRFYLCDEV